ncbi:MAG: carboxypeptidase regulatory-like domain-containing protein [Methanobacteriota archaeon]|nr:MAG: carboxypeptidase regulatory-like domain-containing protein [Euryarchaeota archaeon]
MKWLGANWAPLAMLVFIFLLALFVRSYFAFGVSAENDYIVSGGSDSYYWRRIIDYHVETGESLYWDSLINFPNGIRNPRPPFYSMSVAVPAVAASALFESMSDAVGFMFVWSTAFWGALTVIPVYFLGKETFGRRAGLISAFLLALTPSHVQRSVLSNADHDAFILFFIVLTFYFMLKAVKVQRHDRWIASWRSRSSITAGLSAYFSQSRVPVLYALLAGTSFGCVIMAWVGFAYVAVLMLAYLLVQVLLNKFKNIDSTSVTILVFVTMGFGYLLAYPVYYEQSLILTRFDVPVYLFLAAMIVSLLFVVSRDFPWTMTLPATAMLLIVGVLGVSVLYPELGNAIMTGQGYFVQSKLYSTIAEARAPQFSELAMSFGMVTFFVSLVGLLYSMTRIPKQTSAGSIFIVVWLAAAIFMAISAGRFMFNAAPAFALAAGWVLVIVVDKIGFAGVGKSLKGASGSFTQVFRKSIKIRHIVGALFLAFFVIMPNVWYSVDAGIPAETKREYDKQIYYSMPSFMRPSGYDTYNGSNWYLGAFGYSLPLPSQYYPAAWNWFSEQDADVYPETTRPAYVAWWDYGFEAVQEGQHPTVADNFQNGYQVTGNIIMAQSEEDAIALFAQRLMQASYLGDASKREHITALLDEHGIPSEAVDFALRGPEHQVITEVLDEPDKYGPMSSDISNVNARLVCGREALSSAGLEPLVAFYDDLCEYLGWEIRYFNVDSRMFPIAATNTGIFYAPAKLSDRRILGDSIPIDFFEIKAITDQGNTVALEDITADMTIVDYSIEYTDMFYDSMFYRAMCGFSGADIGTAQDGLPGLSGSVAKVEPMPGWNMTHFKVVYRTTYYNPYPSDLVSSHQNAWVAVSYDEAQELLSKIRSGEIEGVIDQSARSLYMSGTVFLKYYHGAHVSGTVTTGDGEPVPGARVTVQDEYGIPHDSCLTDDHGSYTFLAPFGNLSVVISSGYDGTDAKLVGAETMGTFSLNVTDAQSMRVKEDLDLDGVYDYLITRDFVVESGEVIGDVFWDLNSDGEYAAADDYLIFDGIVHFENLASGEETSVEVSEGYYSASLAPGQYTVYADVLGVELGMSALENITSGKESALNLAVQPSVFKGNVTSVKGVPVAGMTVILQNAFYDCEFTATTNETGGFTILKVVPGRYEVLTDDPHFMLFGERVKLDAESVEEREFTAHDRRSVKFRISLDGTPAPYAPYTIHNTYWPDDYVSGVADRFGWVEADLTKGYWSLYSVFNDGTDDFAGYESLDLCSEETATGVLALEPAYSVDGAPKPRGVGLVKATFVVFVAEDGTRIFIRTDTLGKFDIRLPAGVYDILCWAVSGMSVCSSTVVVNEDISDLRLYSEGGVIVTGDVWLDSDGSGSIGEDEFGAYALLEVTDSYGRTYTTRADDEGDYRFLVTEGSQVEFSVADPGYSGWSMSTLFGDEAKNVTLFVSPDEVTVSGQVIQDGAGIRGVEVAFVPGILSREPVYVTTGTGGYYSADILPGDYSIVIDDAVGVLGGEVLQYESDEVIQPSGETLRYDIYPTRRVEVYGNILGAAEVTGMRMEGPEQVTADVSGFTYSAYAVPGTYHLYAFGATDDTAFAGVLKVDVYAGVRQIDVYLEEAHEVSGVAYVGGVAATKVVSVSAVSEDGAKVAVTTTMSGEFSIDLPPGSYELMFGLESTHSEGDRVLYVEYSSTQIITVSSFDVALDVHLDMHLDNTTFSGTVTGTGGEPVQAQMVLTPNTKYGLGVTLETDASGVFEAPVQPGDYTVYVKRSQDASVTLSLVELRRNEALEYDVKLSEGRFVSGRIIAGGDPVDGAVTISSGDSSLAAYSDASGYFGILLPSGDYVLSSSAEKVEAGMTIKYSLSKPLSVGSFDVFALMDLSRGSTRSIVASWNSSLALPAGIGQTVTYAFTLENTGNIGDDYECQFTASGFEVAFIPESQFIDFGSNGRYATYLVKVTVLEDAPAGNTTVPVLIKSETSSSARATLELMVKVPPVYATEVTVEPEEAPSVSGDMTRTLLHVTNVGNTEAQYDMEIANLEYLNDNGWGARLILKDSGEAVGVMTIEYEGHKEIYLEYTATRNEPNPRVEATVMVWSVEDPGQATIASVPIILPDVSIGPGGLDVVRDDVSYKYDASDLYVNIGLVCAIGGLLASFFILRRRKGLGGRKGKGDRR